MSHPVSPWNGASEKKTFSFERYKHVLNTYLLVPSWYKFGRICPSTEKGTLVFSKRRQFRDLSDFIDVSGSIVRNKTLSLIFPFDGIAQKKTSFAVQMIVR